MADQAKKVQTKAKINWGWDSPENRNGKATRSTKSKRSNSIKIKKLGLKAILIILLIALIGVAAGAGVCWYLTLDDCFTIIGQDEITLTLKGENELFDETNCYHDEGVKVVSFGKDVSEKVYIETNLTKCPDGNYYADEVGTYYIIYRVDDIKYGKIFSLKRIRLITYVESTPENDVEGE